MLTDEEDDLLRWEDDGGHPGFCDTVCVVSFELRDSLPPKPSGKRLTNRPMRESAEPPIDSGNNPQSPEQ